MKIVYGFAAITLAVIIVLGYRFLSSAPPTPQIPVQQNQTTTRNSRYMPYSNEAFAAAADKKRVLYFHADWCPTCRPLDREFTTMMDKIPEDVVIFKANYDTEIDLKQRHAITYQHTFVQVDSRGNEISKWSGGNFDEVISNIQ